MSFGKTSRYPGSPAGAVAPSNSTVERDALNAADVVLTGRKRDKKVYYWHTGYPGGLKQRTAKEQFDRKPEEVLRKAVVGMLPKNRIAKQQADMLHIFPRDEHPHVGQLAGKPPLKL